MGLLKHRHCIFVSAGDHEVWATYAMRYLKDQFHIVVVYYGDDDSKKEELKSSCDEFYARKGSKFQNLHHVYKKSFSRLRSFDTVTVWDDDARIQKGRLQDIISVIENQDGIEIAGAAQHKGGLVPHKFMLPVYDNAVRVTNFTEMNYVTFSSSAISKFMSVYRGDLVGWGMDLFFCQVVDPDLSGKICIVDPVVVLNKQKRHYGPRDGQLSENNVPDYYTYVSEMDNYMSRPKRKKQWDSFAADNGFRGSWNHKEHYAFYPSYIPGIENTGVLHKLPNRPEHPCGTDIRAFHISADFCVTAVCACMNRIDPLKLSLPTWMNCPYIKDIVLVDWSSDTPVKDDPLIRKYINTGYLRVVRVEGESIFSLGKAYNLAVDHADHPVVIKLDTDYVIKSSTWMDTLLLEKRGRKELRNYYVRGSWYFGESFGGFCLFNKSDFPLYNEHLIGWGHDDTDLYERFISNGVEEVTMNSLSDYIFHIPHPVSDRTANYPESDKRKTELANRRISKSKKASDRVHYDHLHKTHQYAVVEYVTKHGQPS